MSDDEVMSRWESAGEEDRWQTAQQLEERVEGLCALLREARTEADMWWGRCMILLTLLWLALSALIVLGTKS